MADIVLTDEKKTTVVTTPTPVRTVVLDDRTSKPAFTETVPDIFVITKTGPPGPRGEQGQAGPEGPAGPTGPKGDTTVTEATTFRWVQMNPAMVWNVEHTLSKRFPEVTVVLSDGSVVQGDVEYLDASLLTISFSAAVSGEAYLT